MEQIENIENLENYNEATQAENDNNFSIPEEYKNRGWTKNIKSTNDLFKAYDNAVGLIGKKTIGIPDFEKATDEELKSFYSKTAPANIEEYKLEDVLELNDDFKNKLGNVFKENGINKKQANNILKAYQEEINKTIGTEDDLNNELNNRFSNFNENKKKEFVKMFSDFLNEDDRKIMSKMPAKVQGIMCSFAENIKNNYGIDFKTSVESSNASISYSLEDLDKKIYEADEARRAGNFSQLSKLNAEIMEIGSKINWENYRRK